jgi:hypothetical protein
VTLTQFIPTLRTGIPGTHGRPSATEICSVVVTTVTDPAILPEDIRVGDLVAIPCRHAARLHDVRIAFDDHPAAHWGR